MGDFKKGDKVIVTERHSGGGVTELKGKVTGLGAQGVFVKLDKDYTTHMFKYGAVRKDR